ncbi:MAG: hypothetical protein IJF33_00680 [Clostridia bacterium]|nr:hypothetical protein [Clostridia bacterium]
MPNFRKQRILGFVLKSLFTLLIFAVNALIIWRVAFSARIPDSVGTLHVNDALREVYEQTDGNLTAQYQNQLSQTYGEDNAGYFGVPEYFFIPEAKQVQVVFRYNNSTLKHLAKDYGLVEVPAKSGEYFDVTLLKVTDLTPEDETDDAVESIRLSPTYVKRDTTQLYTYYRFVFDGVEIDESAICHVYLDVYYLEDLDYEKEPYGTLLLYDQLHEWLPFDLSRADKQALKKAATAE